MFLRKLARPLVALPLVAFLMSAGCTSDTEELSARDRDIRTLINQGKDRLGQNQWGHAEEAFRHVLEEYDPLNSEARFGVVLSQLLSFSDTIRLVTSLTGGLAPKSQEENQFVNQLITDLIHDLRGKFEAMDRDLFLVQADPGFTFRIKSLPIYLTDSDEPTLDLKGEFDRGDAFLLGAPIRAVVGVLNIADSVDLNLDILRAYDYFAVAGADNLSDLVGVVTYVLNDPNYPDFLSVKADGGNELVVKGGKQLGEAVKLFQTALYLTSLETDDQEGENDAKATSHDAMERDILGYVDRAQGSAKKGNGRYDPPLEPLADRCTDLEAQMEADPRRDPDEGPEPFRILDTELGNTTGLRFLSEQTACLLQKIRVNLTWADIQSPPEGLLATDLAQLENYASMYAERPRINLLVDLGPLIDSVASGFIGLPKGGLLPQIESILGDTIELDPYAFFQVNGSGRAGNVRDLLPAWQTEPCTSKEECLLVKNQFVMELECAATAGEIPLPVSDKLTCVDGWVEMDTPHFASEVTNLTTNFGLDIIGEDGFVSYLPYIAFQDASLHGLLYLNLGSLAKNFAGDNADVGEGLAQLDASDADFRPATLIELNAFVGALSRDGVVGGFIVDALKDM